MAFSSKINGNYNLQGNVQVYNVRIPVELEDVGVSFLRLDLDPGKMQNGIGFLAVSKKK